jgi:hypothetical protein
MSMDPTLPQQALLAHFRAAILGGRVTTSLPEESELEKVDGEVLPYAVLSFGMPYPQAGDRSIENEAAQPHIQPWTLECWAQDQDSAQASANAAFAETISFIPTADCSEVRARNGGTFARTDAQGRPTRSMVPLQGEFGFNLSSAP